MKPYYYIARIRVLISFTYRFEVFSGLAVNTVLLLTSVFLWQTVYRNTQVMSGVNKSQMVTYAIISVILGTILVSDIHWRINQRIREGNISLDIIRPVRLPLFWLAEDFGIAFSSILLYILPLLIISLPLGQLPLPASLTAFLIFIPSCLLSYIILWLMSAMVAMIAFWVLELGNTFIIKDAIIRFLSGSIVPLWFFPKSFQNICRFMPFMYTYQGPLGIYIGKYNIQQALIIMGIQILWIFILSLIFIFIWSRARKRVQIQGG